VCEVDEFASDGGSYRADPVGQLLPHEASHATDLLQSHAKCLFSTHFL